MVTATCRQRAGNEAGRESSRNDASMSAAYLEILRRVYAADVARQTADSIIELVRVARARIEPDKHILSSDDIVLITYGDSIRKTGCSPLAALRDFYRQFLADSMNSIHILPFHPFTSDDGFSVVDYYSIDPALGDWSDIEMLGADTRLMFDAVINHISSSSVWFKSFMSGDEKYADWFIEVDPQEDLSMVTRPRALPLLTEMSDESGKKHHIWTTFSDDQVDLNFANPQVLLALLQVLLFYLSKGAKFIRLDAIAFVWKQIGTNCIHLPQTHDLVRLIRRVVEDVNAATMIVTETNVPHEENMAYFGDGYDQAHMVYNFALPPLVAHSLLAGSATKLLRWAQELRLPSDQTCFFNFTASHDGIGIRPIESLLTRDEVRLLLSATEDRGGLISYSQDTKGNRFPYELNISFADLLSSPDDTDDLRARRLLASQAIALAMPGVPAVYIHSLLGSRNDLLAVKQRKCKRAINRSTLGLDKLRAQLADRSSFRSMVFTQMVDMLKTRRCARAFDPYGEFSFPDIDERLFSVLRKWEGHSVLCLTNVSSTSVLIGLELPMSSARELISGTDVSLNEVCVPGYGTLWLDMKGNQEN